MRAWSEPVHGVSGRLKVVFEDLEPGLRHAVYLELRNHSSHPIAVVDQPVVHAEVWDSSRDPVATSGILVSGPMPAARWTLIPGGGRGGYRIDMRTVGVPTRAHKTVLLAVGGISWALKPGEYVLRTRLEFESAENGPWNQWVGELTLPPFDIVVTNEMVSSG